MDIVASSDGRYFFENKWGESCIYALIGFIIVFIGIALIILIIWLIGLLMRKTNNLAFLTNIGKKKRKKEAVQEVTEGAAEEEEISPEVRAAIVAAIAAYYFADKPKCEFRVKRIKKI